MRGFFLGVLLCAAPLYSQTELFGIHLDESQAEIRKAIGEPVLVADINAEFTSWQYRAGSVDHDDFSHSLVFRRSDGALVSISRSFEEPVPVDHLFPAASTNYYRYPDTGNAQMTVRVRRLPGQRFLLAFGSGKPGERSTQLVLIHGSVLPAFYPWLDGKLH